MCDQQRLRSACAKAQSDQSLCSLFEYSATFKQPTEHLLDFLRLKGGCTGSTESTLVKITCRGSYYFIKMQMSLGNNKINGQELVIFPSCFNSGTYIQQIEDLT